jgi:hypothetical protein
MNSVGELRAKTLSDVEEGDMALVTGYYTAGDRGGGWFMWQGSVGQPDDGGLYIEPSVTHPSGGRWVRILNADVANVRMWGAKGDGARNDTTNVQNAVRQRLTGELLFPQGSYLVTNTIVFNSLLHIRGEGPINNTIVLMQGGKDVFRTLNASNALAGYPYDFDHGLLFENIYIDAGLDGTTNAALVLCRPGEAHSIRNVYTYGGGYGIRCFGVGAPGLKLMHVSTFDPYVAGVSIEGFLPNGTFIYAGGGPVSLIGLSGDHRRTNSDATACLLRLDKVTPTVSLYDFKAEGQWGGGLAYFHYYIDPNYAPGPGDNIGSLNIYGGTYNCGGTPSVPCDLVVLKSQGGRTASVAINTMDIFGVRYLIRDEFSGRNVKPNTQLGSALNQQACRQPIQYESLFDNSWSMYRNRFLIGDTAVYELFPPTNGWYRVMTTQIFHMGGRLTIGSYTDGSEIQVDSDLGASAGDIKLDVLRASRDEGSGFRPRVTKVRAGTYDCPALVGSRSFVDIYVERLPDADEGIILSHPLEGKGKWMTQLLSPTDIVTDIVPAGCNLDLCVTNSLVR